MLAANFPLLVIGDPLPYMLISMASFTFQCFHHFLEIFIIYFAARDLLYPFFSRLGRP